MPLKVKLNKYSEFAKPIPQLPGGDPCNPLDTEGYIIGFDGLDDLSLHVRWSNGFTNWYAPKDLENM